MTERPILFSAPMVRALLDGAKSQTRRIVKLPPASETLGTWEPTTVGGPDGGRTAAGDTVPERCALWHTRTGHVEGSPFVAGGRLWVREAFCVGYEYEKGEYTAIPFAGCEAHRRAFYQATDDDKSDEARRPWKPSIFMPRWASRITLEVVAVRVERLLDITDKDAVAEGVVYANPPDGPDGCAAAALYRDLFYRINKAVAAGSNPWVWVVEFKRC